MHMHKGEIVLKSLHGKYIDVTNKEVEEAVINLPKKRGLKKIAQNNFFNLNFIIFDKIIIYFIYKLINKVFY